MTRAATTPASTSRSPPSAPDGAAAPFHATLEVGDHTG